MTRKCHNHTPQSNPRHREEEQRTITATRHQDSIKVKQLIGLFTKPRTCTLVNFTEETKNFLDCLLFL